MLRQTWLFLLGATIAGCSVPAIADVSVGPFDYTISASRLMVPEAFRDDATMTIRRVPCSDDQSCPQLGADQPTVRCVSGACDPDPFTFVLSSDLIDLNNHSSIRRYGDAVTRIEVRSAHFEAVAQGLRNPIGPTEILWGPESAVTIDSPEVHVLGTIPVIDLSMADSTTGEIELNPAGNAALSDYLVRGSRRLRLFARPRVDVFPGSPIPVGSVVLRVQLGVHVEGQLVR